MKFVRNVFIALVIVLIVIIGAIGVLLNRWMYGPLPQHDGEITVSGLMDTVSIQRDEWGVPHIYASNTHDLLFAQGYTQAQDRWWQMEFSRAIGRGEIQQLTGRQSSVMGQDVFIRTVGWRRSAEADLQQMDTETVTKLQAFADGVNAYISGKEAGELAFEYNALGITGVNIPIRPWEPVDTVVWTKVMAWDLSSNWSAELALSDMLAVLGDDIVSDYVPEWPYGDKPTIIQPEDLPEEGESFAEHVARFEGIRGLGLDSVANANGLQTIGFGTGEGIGSNNWVVSGDITASGMPLLANDPHLGIQMPSIWYEIGLHCQPVGEDCPYNVVGFAFPAAPSVVVGHNDHIGWGVTNTSWDTQDLYTIEVNPDNPLQYRYNGEWRDMTVYEETINFGDSDEPVTIQVRETHFGPIINDNDLDEDGNPMGFNNEDPVAMRWAAYEPTTLIDALFALDAASNWEEFRAALAYWDMPSQNFVYADTEGNIGYQTPGHIPVRAPGHTGLLPVDGSTDEYEWLGYIPYDNLPTVFNPERHYIASANQAQVPLEYYEQLATTLADTFGEDANYAFSYQWAQGYRAERIVELLEATDSHTIETFQAIHGDNKLIFAEEIAPYLAELTFEDDTLTEARDWLLTWDYQLHMDSPQAPLFVAFYVALLDDLYQDQLGDLNEAGNSEMWATSLLMAEPDNIWWDDSTTDATETRDDILVKAFTEGYNATVEQLGNDRDTWRWGTLHMTTMVSNPLGASGIDPLEDMVNAGPVETSGGSDVVNATKWSAEDGDYTVSAGPSMRMILDMDDLSNSRVMHTTGQSGHPFSGQYADMVDPWRNIEYHTMLWTPEQVAEAAVSTLTLNPE
ncbi:penicillin acylase family protein [Phototrophicus methaneseepsis]|uniref:Penicillin acylase family protein n=1 Tax=Phototrophicus methaneseepsis TaxID=2710758 RepID=A0A7S8ICI3_9CHLR|nr:penicillin acylase family protein [Phototrophicus methaneseepsis]QPC81585.1 penicillin acylase family protein [Phototrophicus methaneseepsis]